MTPRVVTLQRGHLTVFVPYSFERPEPRIELRPPEWLELTDEERDDLELAVLEQQGDRDD